MKELFQSDIIKRLLSVFILFAAIYVMKDLMDLFLLTFLLTYLIYSFEQFLLGIIRKRIRFNETLLILMLYVVIFISLGFFIYKYVPIIIGQTLGIINEVSKSNVLNVDKYIIPVFGQFDINAYLKNQMDYILKMAANIGKWGVNLFISLMLSLFFLLGKEKIRGFLKAFSKSRISGLYVGIVSFAHSFFTSFGKVIQAQILIALTNSALSMIVLSLLGFPQLFALGFMIFILSLVPVAGVIISLVPLTVIAYSIGGIIKVIYVIILILLLHGLESYILNPQFMSSKTDIPVFFVFIILIISEHFFGLWGFLTGLPMAMYALEIIGLNFQSKLKKE
ncbi:MAG: AI-2E family transporter [Solirubrobacterales bacterium]